MMITLSLKSAIVAADRADWSDGMTALFIAAYPHDPDRAAAEIVALAGKVAVGELAARADNAVRDGLDDNAIRLALLALAPKPPDYAELLTDLTAQQKFIKPEEPPSKYASIVQGRYEGVDPMNPIGTTRDKANRRKHHSGEPEIAAGVKDEVYDW
jgi:hypothetical protein